MRRLTAGDGGAMRPNINVSRLWVESWKMEERVCYLLDTRETAMEMREIAGQQMPTGCAKGLRVLEFPLEQRIHESLRSLDSAEAVIPRNILGPHHQQSLSPLPRRFLQLWSV